MATVIIRFIDPQGDPVYRIQPEWFDAGTIETARKHARAFLAANNLKLPAKARRVIPDDHELLQ